jgi:hypothetical protein
LYLCLYWNKISKEQSYLYKANHSPILLPIHPQPFPIQRLCHGKEGQGSASTSSFSVTQWHLAFAFSHSTEAVSFKGCQ